MWVRGLKPAFKLHDLAIANRSHPVWVRGLKLLIGLSIMIVYMSHPVWVRGLKQRNELLYEIDGDVAPRVGAWIETVLMG